MDGDKERKLSEIEELYGQAADRVLKQLSVVIAYAIDTGNHHMMNHLQDNILAMLEKAYTIFDGGSYHDLDLLKYLH